MAPPPTIQAPRGLLDVPTEIRVQIYGHLFRDLQIDIINGLAGPNIVNSALLLTNRALYNELAPLILSFTTLTFWGSIGPDRAVPSNDIRRSVRRVVFTLNPGPGIAAMPVNRPMTGLTMGVMRPYHNLREVYLDCYYIALVSDRAGGESLAQFLTSPAGPRDVWLATETFIELNAAVPRYPPMQHCVRWAPLQRVLQTPYNRQGPASTARRFRITLNVILDIMDVNNMHYWLVGQP